MTNQISKTTFLKYLRCPRAAAFEGDAAAIVRDYQRNLAHIGGEEKAKILEEETKEKLRQLFIRLIENDEGGAESEAEIESGDFDGLLKDDLTLKAMLSTYFKIEQLTAQKAKKTFGGQVLSGMRVGDQVIGQRYINLFKDGFNFHSFVDVVQEDDSAVRIIEAKSTTSKKFAELGPKKNKELCPIFERSPLGVLRLKEDFEGFKPFDKYYDNREKLMDRFRDVGRYVYDLAWQRYIIENSTDDKREYRYYLAVLNSDYVFDGRQDEKGENIYDADDLIVLVDLTQVTKDMLLIVDRDVNTVIDRINKPDFSRVPLEKPKCKINGSYDQCPWLKICMKDLMVPDKNSLYVYRGGYTGFGPASDKSKEKVQKEKIEELIWRGITKALDIDYDWLNDTQKVQYDVIKSGKAFVDKKVIKAMFKDLKYPLFHLDFETMNFPIPMYRGEVPYQQSLFQYSLHIERTPGVCDKEKDNVSFLSTGKTDDREEFIKSMIKNIPANQGGTVIVYNAIFESGRLRELIEMFPKYAVELNSILERIYDLKDILDPSKKIIADYEYLKSKPCSFNYYNESFQRSYSIKKVLPVFAPHLDYANLDEVHNGLDAQAAFMRLKYLEGKAFDETYKNMIEYCKQDTWAMFEIMQGLRKLINEK